MGVQGSFKRNGLIMSTGAGINVVTSVILTPIVTRLYTEEEFGVFYLFLSIVTISSLIICGMYPQAFVIPVEKEKFLALLKLTFILLIIGFIILTLLSILFSDVFLQWINGKALTNYMWLIPIGMFFIALNTIFINWNIRRKEFASNAVAQITTSSGNKLFQITSGLTLGGTYAGLVYADILSKIIGSLVLLKRDMFKDLKESFNVPFTQIKHIAREYKNYPKYVLTGNFVNRFSEDIPLYILSSYFGIGAVGAFGFANQMLGIPYNVIGKSISPVYFQRANELYLEDKEKLKAFTITFYNKMLVLGCLAFGFVYAFGDIFFGWFFSEKWSMAGQVASILSIYYVFKLISSPFSGIYRVVRKESYTLLINILISFLRIIGIYVGVSSGDYLLAISIYAGANMVGYLINNILVFISIDIPLTKIFLRTIAVFLFVFSLFYLLRIAFDRMV